MEPKHSHKRALVIDDDEDLTALIELVLSRHGTEVYTAFTGQQGLQYFKEVQPDVVILDVMLPGMNGWEVLNRLRATSDVPVIVHTVLTDADSRKMKGAHGHLIGYNVQVAVDAKHDLKGLLDRA